MFVQLFMSRSIGSRPVPRLPGMVGNGDENFADIVRVVRFLQLVADRLSICINLLQEPAWLPQCRFEGRIHGDANDVIARRDGRLAIAAIQNKELSSQEESIRVGPPVADSLIARDSHRAAVSELRALRLLSAGG